MEENLPAGEETPAVEDAPPATDNEVPPGEQGAPPDDANRAEVAEVAAGLLNIGVDIDPHEHLYSATTFDELNLYVSSIFTVCNVFDTRNHTVQS